MPTKTSTKPLTFKELSEVGRQYRDALTPRRLTEACEKSQLPASALESFSIGYDPERARWTFPMVNGDSRLCGFALWGSSSGILKGSMPGLFVPQGYDIPDCPLLLDGATLLILPQGPIEAAAVHAMGLRVIGRLLPNSAADEVKNFIDRKGPSQEVAMVCPAGKGHASYESGVVGVVNLAEIIFPLTEKRKDEADPRISRLRCLKPPAGMTCREAMPDATNVFLALAATCGKRDVDFFGEVITAKWLAAAKRAPVLRKAARIS